MPTPTKWPQLKDRVWVFNQLTVLRRSMQDVAEEVGCPASSVRWVVNRYATPEQKASMFYERKPHSNRVKKHREPVVAEAL